MEVDWMRRHFIFYNQERRALEDPGSPIIHHRSLFRKIWDAVVLVILAYMVVATPFIIGFAIDDVVINTVAIMIDFVFLVDLVINSISTYEDENRNVVMEWKSIIVEYLYGWFFVDLVSSIPFQLFMDGGEESEEVQFVKFFKILKLMRLARLGRMADRIKETCDLKNITLTIFKFLLVLFMSAHWLACMFHLFTGNVQDPHHDTWLSTFLSGSKHGPIEARSTFEIYVACLYWALATMSTIGYGDIIPKTTLERMVTSVAMIVGACMFSYCLTNVCSLVFNFNQHQTNWESGTDDYIEYMSRNNMPLGLKQRAFRYLWFVHDSARVEDSPMLESSIMNSISPALREELKVARMSAVTVQAERSSKDGGSGRHPIFSVDNLPGYHGFSLLLADAFEGTVFSIDDVIIDGSKEPVLVDYIYLIIQGLVKCTHRDGTMVSLPKGSSFGEVSLLLHQELQGTRFKPEIITEIWCVRKEAIKAAMVRYPEIIKVLQHAFREHGLDYMLPNHIEKLQARVTDLAEEALRGPTLSRIKTHQVETTDSKRVCSPLASKVLMRDAVLEAPSPPAEMQQSVEARLQKAIGRAQGEIVKSQDRLLSLQDEHMRLKLAQLDVASAVTTEGKKQQTKRRLSNTMEQSKVIIDAMPEGPRKDALTAQMSRAEARMAA